MFELNPEAGEATSMHNNSDETELNFGRGASSRFDSIEENPNDDEMRVK